MNSSVRLKWEFKNEEAVSGSSNIVAASRNQLLDLIEGDILTSHYQPIFSAKSCSAFGYEALLRSRNGEVLDNIPDLFERAKQAKIIASLDMKCRENAIKEAALLGLSNTQASLFINICPESILDPTHSVGVTDSLAEEWGVAKERIILEITENGAIHNYKLFQETINYYRKAGYRIAIDDFGAGYGGLKMLSMIEPEFVKIDRHFISNIDKAMVKYTLVDSIATACHRMGIKVIAEGVETEDELNIVLDMGIELIQGFLLSRPSASLDYGPSAVTFLDSKRVPASDKYSPAMDFIGDVAIRVGSINSDTSIKNALNMFIDDSCLKSLPIVDRERLVGMLYRSRFIEDQVVGKFGYGVHLNSHKNIGHVMETAFLSVDDNTTIEDVAHMVQRRKPDFMYDDICVTKNGKYFGLVSVSSLLDAITGKSIILAKGANPLTGLPGNEAIQREIEKKIAHNIHFDVVYVDINWFKPYNDYYGFERGDFVIKSLAKILSDTMESYMNDGLDFVGHIGGDDFIFIARPQAALQAAERVVRDFESMQPVFHGAVDYSRGFYTAKNRKDEDEIFRLLTVSIGIVSTEVHSIDSYAQLASRAVEVKSASKKQSSEKGRSAIVRDRRLM
ncbi:MAG: GGDEF domain-containing protein [Nitrospirae bacterium]|nr:MAG: GGDEF domain-containing protein [Nitrospirota bacterium]